MTDGFFELAKNKITDTPEDMVWSSATFGDSLNTIFVYDSEEPKLRHQSFKYILKLINFLDWSLREIEEWIMEDPTSFVMIKDEIGDWKKVDLENE